MTALRDRASDPAADEVAVPWDTRPVIGERQGMPWWGAVLLAFGLAILGAVVDMQMQNAISWVFYVCYFLGSVGAICAVQRRGLFGPMVQPPLVLAVSVPLVILFVSGLPSGSDTLSKVLAVGTPLINGFPAMAITTGCTLVIGIFRIYRQRDPEAQSKGTKPAATAGQRPSKPARPAEEGGRPRPVQPGRVGSAARGQRPPEARSGPQRRPPGEAPQAPAGRRQPPDDGPRRGGDPGVRGKTPPPGGRRPRGPVPEEGERRRAGGPPRPDRPRRMPPRSGDPRGAPPSGDPRRAPGRNAPPPRRRPWDDEG